MATSPVYQVVVADLANSPILDISDRTYDLVVGPRMNSADISEGRTLTRGLGDLIRNGDRRVHVYRNGQLVSNNVVWNTNGQGDRTQAWVQWRAVGPLMRAQTRWVQDAGGQIFDGISADGSDRGLDLPAGALLNPALAIGAGPLLKECFDNTIANDGPMSLTTSGGTFEGSLNVRFALRNITPLRLGDLITKLVEMNAVDVTVAPTIAGEIAGVVSAVTRAGGSSGAHFQYATGAFNCEAAGVVGSMDEFANKIWHELGQREGSHFKNNITRDAPGVTVDDSASRAQYGVYHDIRIVDDFSGVVKNTSPLYAGFVRNYNGELAQRMKPKKIIWVTPQAGAAPEPWTGYQLGSTALASIVDLGEAILGVTVRIHGWNAMPQNDRSEKVTLFLQSDTE